MVETNKDLAKLNRREFLAGIGLTTLAIAGGSLTSSCSSNKEHKSSHSGMISIAQGANADLYPEYKDGQYLTKDFSYLTKNPDLGLSPANISHHLGLYANYVKKVNAAEAAMRKNQIDDNSMKNLAFSLNGMFLHDIYFSTMSTEKTKYSAALEKALTDSFGSFDNYMNNLLSLAFKKKGWSITAVNLLNGSIFNYATDDHSANFPGYVMPILALDVYEHAYEADFSTSKEGKAQYLALFPSIINWDMVSRRFDHASQLFA